MRIFLFFFTNLSIILIFGIILFLTGIHLNSILNILIISIILGFLGSIISLLICKWIALYSVNGNIIKNPKNNIEKWLFNIVKKQAYNVNIDMPEIAIYNSKDMNAFATGMQRNSSLIAISSALLKNMNLKEIEAVIAHEITHIDNGDMVTMTLIQGTINTFIIFISRILTKIFTTFLYKNQKEKHQYEYFNSYQYSYCSFISMILEFTLGILANIIIMWFSRNREFYADAGSAKLVGYKNMISALEKLKNSHEVNIPENIITLCINGKSQTIFNLFLSHPPLDQRIYALKKRLYI